MTLRTAAWAGALAAVLLVCALIFLVSAVEKTEAAAADNGAVNVDPYANNNGAALPKDYKGPRYRLNHNYPGYATPVVDPPWRKALNGKPIGKDNAIAYVQALKNHVAKDLRLLVNDYTKWDPIAAGWYDQPWIAAKTPKWPGREPIQGAYPGPSFTRTTYPDLKVPFIQDYVMVYYNPTAAFTLHQVWQTSGPSKPQPANAQFTEGAIITKLATTTASGADWAPMEGTSKSAVFVPAPTADDPTPPGVPPRIIPVYTMQLDLIVKDTKTAPKTGWVFSTLVYDKSAPGQTTWDKMVPLGAAWGNDPDVEKGDLRETVINPNAPAYSKITLGWGGRLSGPNDAAAEGNGKGGYTRFSSCMSCHGTAEFPNGAKLVPLSNKPGSTAWKQWFQDRNGTTPQNPNGTALDYDMVTLQALVNWQAATGSAQGKALAEERMRELRLRGHRRLQ